MSRKYRGQRWIRIGLRTVHIAAASVVGGGAFYGHPANGWAGLLVASGGAIVLDDVYKYGGDYFRYLQSWAVIVKLVLLWIGLVSGSLLFCLALALVIGSVVSHAPGYVRQHAFWGPNGPCADKER